MPDIYKNVWFEKEIIDKAITMLKRENQVGQSQVGIFITEKGVEELKRLKQKFTILRRPIIVPELERSLSGWSVYGKTDEERRAKGGVMK
ncbi:MAG: hypothetical protein QMD71_09695 [bacterium]|nr:hypothetical protein [bacterium]